MYRPVSVDGVLLSHAHLDHSGYTSFLDPEIPVYCSAMTAFVSRAIQDTGQADFEAEVCYIHQREGACRWVAQVDQGAEAVTFRVPRWDTQSGSRLGVLE